MHLSTITLALVALSAAFASASHPLGSKGHGGDGQRLVRKRYSSPNGPVVNRDGSDNLEEGSHPLSKRDFSGRATFYDPSVGAGHCGRVMQNSDPIVAVNSAQFDTSLCFTWITVRANGRTARAQITDSCPSCSYGSLDFSPAVFNQFASPDQGVFQMSWVFGSGNNNPQPTSTRTRHRTTSQYTPPSSTWTPPTSSWTPPTSTRRTRRPSPTPTTSASSSSSFTSSESATSSSTEATTTTSASTSSDSSEATGSSSEDDSSATDSAADSVSTLGSGGTVVANGNNLGLLSQAVGGFAALAQVVSGKTDTL